MKKLSKWTVEIWKSEAWPLLPFFSVVALLLSFGAIADGVTDKSTLAFDRYVMFVFRSSSNNFSNPIGPTWVQEMARDVTSLGSFSVLGILLVVVVGYLLATRKRESALLVILAVLGGVALSSLLKYVFARPRPELFAPAARVFTASFPSDHATLSAVTYMTLAALLARTVGSAAVQTYFMGVAIALTFLIGVSRVYLGVHYPTDILAGWCIGSAWAITCWIIITKSKWGDGDLVRGSYSDS